MDLDNLIKLITIRNYVAVAASNMHVDVNKVRAMNNLLMLLDNKLIGLMSNAGFSEALNGLMDVSKPDQVVEKVDEKKRSGLVKLKK